MDRMCFDHWPLFFNFFERAEFMLDPRIQSYNDNGPSKNLKCQANLWWWFIILGKKKMEGSVRVLYLLKSPMLTGSSIPCKGKGWQLKPWSYSRETIFTSKRFEFNCCGEAGMGRKIVYRNGKDIICHGFLFPVDPWAPSIDSQSIASLLFAFSLFPYLVFLYFITKSKTAPRLTLFGFYFLLAFVGATIPAGIYAKVHYGTSLSNVDWLHGGAESLLTLTNLFIVLGLRDAIRKAGGENGNTSEFASKGKEEDKPSI